MPQIVGFAVEKKPQFPYMPWEKRKATIYSGFNVMGDEVLLLKLENKHALVLGYWVIDRERLDYFWDVTWI